LVTLGGGKLFTSDEPNMVKLKSALEQVAQNHGVTAEHIAYSWLLNHPANIVVIAGSSKYDRVKSAVEAKDIVLDRQECSIYWSRLLVNPYLNRQ